MRSPIDHLTKEEVRALARLLGLPNWQHAASPCLRSRLALGVPALEDHLRRVETAEQVVRRTLGSGVVQVQHNVRVRMLALGRGAVELDTELLPLAAPFMEKIGRELARLGFDGGVTLRAFKSGSVGVSTRNGGAGGGVVVTRSGAAHSGGDSKR